MPDILFLKNTKSLKFYIENIIILLFQEIKKFFPMFLFVLNLIFELSDIQNYFLKLLSICWTFSKFLSIFDI